MLPGNEDWQKLIEFFPRDAAFATWLTGEVAALRRRAALRETALILYTLNTWIGGSLEKPIVYSDSPDWQPEENR